MGAAPVQNIGAYGVEVSSFIHSVECFNLLTRQQETIKKMNVDLNIEIQSSNQRIILF